MFTYSDDCFSDLFKDVNGFRPRGSLMDDWNDRTPRQKQELWNALCDELEENSKAEAASAKALVAEFETWINSTIELGAGNRESALRWITSESKFQNSQCVEHFVWNQGILFTDQGREVVKELNNIYFAYKNQLGCCL